MFWRRSGSRFDNDKSLLAWIMRFVILVFLVLGVILIIRLLAPGDVQAAKTLPGPLEAGWEGRKTCELLVDNDEMRAARCAFPPGIGHERHYHPPHWGYVVSGALLKITDEDGVREQMMASGQSWWSDGVKWHEAINIGETTAEYIIVEPKMLTEE